MIDKLVDLYVDALPLTVYLLLACGAAWLTEKWPPGMQMWDKLTGRWWK